jgi:hypothetical protein
MSRPILRALLCFATLAAFSQLADAASQAVPDYQIYQPYVSPRALGMGNAFTAVADDYSALFYNPAGLARLQEGEFNMFIGAAIDGKSQQFTKDLDTAMNSNTATTDLSALIANNYGNHFYTRTPTIGIAWVRPKWGFAIIPADLSLDLSIHQEVGPAINVVATNDSTIAFGLAKNLKNTGDHKVSIGMTLKTIYRAYYAQAVPAAQLATDQQVFRTDIAEEGATIDADIGTLWTPPVPTSGMFHWLRFAQPTFAFVVRNVGDYGFPIGTTFINDTHQRPPNLGRRFDVGSKFELPKWWVFTPRLTADERDMSSRNFTVTKGSHLGLELDWKVRSWLHGGYRMGLNQGYWTGGISAALGVFLLDFATWGEEVGTTDSPQENRRYMARASLDF